MNNGWQTPFLSVLTGTDKDALQRIFSSLQAELARLQTEIDILKEKNAFKYKEQTRY
jgi:hypothetical protein